MKSNSEGEESSSMDMTENGHLMREDLEEHPLVGRMTILQNRISELAASETLLQLKIEELKVIILKRGCKVKFSFVVYMYPFPNR